MSHIVKISNIQTDDNDQLKRRTGMSDRKNNDLSSMPVTKTAFHEIARRAKSTEIFKSSPKKSGYITPDSEDFFSSYHFFSRPTKTPLDGVS